MSDLVYLLFKKKKKNVWYATFVMTHAWNLYGSKWVWHCMQPLFTLTIFPPNVKHQHLLSQLTFWKFCEITKAMFSAIYCSSSQIPKKILESNFFGPSFNKIQTWWSSVRSSKEREKIPKYFRFHDNSCNFWLQANPLSVCL